MILILGVSCRVSVHLIRTCVVDFVLSSDQCLVSLCVCVYSACSGQFSCFSNTVFSLSAQPMHSVFSWFYSLCILLHHIYVRGEMTAKVIVYLQLMFRIPSF